MKFNVQLEGLFTVDYQLEAESQMDAIAKAEEMLKQRCREISCKVDTATVNDHFTVTN